MAKGDMYDARKYNWQVRKLPDGRVFVRYDDLPIDEKNKGRYNTSPIVRTETIASDEIRFTTQSGSQYYFSVSKCAHPMQLIALQLKFGVEF